MSNRSGVDRAGREDYKFLALATTVNREDSVTLDAALTKGEGKRLWSWEEEYCRVQKKLERIYSKDEPTSGRRGCRR